MQDPVAFFISQLNSANKTEKRTSESDLANIETRSCLLPPEARGKSCPQYSEVDDAQHPAHHLRSASEKEA